MSKALEDIAAERQRQIDVEGYTSAEDDGYVNGAVAEAAAAYAMSAAGNSADAHATWPWKMASFKPTNPRRDLVKAGALIIAEIERLDRAEAGGK